MKPVDVKSSAYINSNKEVDDEDPKFKICDIVKISKCKNIFAKCNVPNWSEDVFVIKKVKNIIDLNHKEIVGTYYHFKKNNFKKNIQKFIVEKSNKGKRR